MIKLLKIFIVSFAILNLTSCKSKIKIPLPEIAVCTILSEGAICTDKRLEPENQEYELFFSEMTGYQAVSIDDYKDLMKDIYSKRKELAKLRKNCDK